MGEELSVDELAKMAALSPFYYQRLFSRLVKKPVAEYIRLRRMARATDALLRGIYAIYVKIYRRHGYGFESNRYGASTAN